MNDLISRNALKKAIEDRVTFIDGDSLYKIIDLIDNAESIKPCENCDLYFKAMAVKTMRETERND